jgi:hypothetical protein
LRYSPEASLSRPKELSFAASASSSVTPHLVIFMACFCILAGALIITPADFTTNHLELGGISLPQTCIFKNLTGLPCPGCGLSRSVVAAAHGDIGMSLMHHRLGLLTLFYIVLQFMYGLGLIVVPKWWIRIFPSGKFLNRGMVVLGALFMLNWILTLVLMWLS